MSALAQLTEDYLETRRALGYKLIGQGRILAAFVRYLDERGATRITIESALDFATQPADADPIWWRHRLSAVRGLAVYVQAIDPTTEVPPTRLLGGVSPRAVPYLYEENEIVGLLAAASVQQPTLRAATYETLIGLLAVTGMRVGEAIALNRDHVDLDSGLLTIAHPKFDRSRIVPLCPSTTAALARYAARRDELRPSCTEPSFFVSIRGTRLIYGCIQRSFSQLVQQVGLEPRSERCRPRLHDFRHRFAVETLLGWYRSGADVTANMPLLSTFLGHAKPANTFWYLSATPELFSIVADRLERSEVAR